MFLFDPMKVIIAGSRSITNPGLIDKAVLESKFPISWVVCGGASGVDALGEEWALRNHIPITYFPAKWELHGKSAGMIRNRKMSEWADALIAVWDGKSRGTRHMIDIMRKMDKPAFVLIA